MGSETISIEFGCSSEDFKAFDHWDERGMACFLPAPEDSCVTGAACGPDADGYYRMSLDQVTKAKGNLELVVGIEEYPEEVQRIKNQVAQYGMALEAHPA